MTRSLFAEKLKIILINIPSDELCDPPLPLVNIPQISLGFSCLSVFLGDENFFTIAPPVLLPTKFDT